MRALLLSVVMACGGSSPAPTAPTPKPVAPAVAAQPAPSPAPAPAPPPVAPDPDAPPTPPRTYDEAQCKERVALFAKRAMAANDHTATTMSLINRTVSADTADSMKAPALVVWMVPEAGMRGEFCGAWITELVLNGKTLSRQSGKTRDAKTLAAVKKRLAKGGTIGINITPGMQLETALPLLTDLAKLGPLALRVAAPAPAFTLPLDEAPAWAVERYRALEHSKSPHSILAAGIRDSASGCPAHKTANDKVVNDQGGAKGWIVAVEYPKAVAACKCTNVDVDALELFTLAVLGGPFHPAKEGFLELRLDARATPRVAAPTSSELARELAKLPRDQRSAGIAIDPGPPVATRFPGRC